MRIWGRSFHEMPLVAFTTLAAAGAGAAVVRPAGGRLQAVYSPATSGLIALALIGAGLAFSLLHLGRKTRGWRALTRIGRSPLSTEIAAAVATMAALGFGLPRVSAAAALALLLTLGLVYRIPGQASWGCEGVFTPLLLGAAFGLAVLFEGTGGEVLIVLALDLVLASLSRARLEREAHRGVPAHPRLFAVRGWIAAARTLAVTILPSIGLLFSGTVAGSLLLAGILTDRFAFYALALQRSTEAEISRVERLIASAILGSWSQTRRP